MSMRFYIPDEATRKEPYHLKGIGLPDVYLLNGVEIEDDPGHGQLVTVKNLSGLHKAIGMHIANGKDAMTGAEFRFLRKQMELTQKELGEWMKVSEQSIANYEKATHAQIAASAHLRLLYVLGILPPDLPLKHLLGIRDAIVKADIKIPDQQMQKISGGWLEPRPTRKAA
jgi:DNA-binding transcriptional regulator YiaG